MKKESVRLLKLTTTALLIAIGILIPMTFPRVIIGPASFTLASHVVIFIGMWISPKVAISVAVGTTVGFFMAGFPLVIVMRAFSHIGWVVLGSIYLTQVKKQAMGLSHRVSFSLVIGMIHGILEFFMVMLFFFGTNFPEDFDVMWFVWFVGVGTMIHSLVDLELAHVVLRRLFKIGKAQALFE